MANLFARVGTSDCVTAKVLLALAYVIQPFYLVWVIFVPPSSGQSEQVVCRAGRAPAITQQARPINARTPADLYTFVPQTARIGHPPRQAYARLLMVFSRFVSTATWSSCSGLFPRNSVHIACASVAYGAC